MDLPKPGLRRPTHNLECGVLFHICLHRAHLAGREMRGDDADFRCLFLYLCTISVYRSIYLYIYLVIYVHESRSIQIYLSVSISIYIYVIGLVPTPTIVVQESFSLRVLLCLLWSACSCVSRSFIYSL